MYDSKQVIGIYYFQVAGLPCALGAYHAGFYYSFKNDADVRTTLTWDAGPTIQAKDIPLNGFPELVSEYVGGVAIPSSPTGPIAVETNSLFSNDNQVVLPLGAIPGPELLRGYDLSQHAGNRSAPSIRL